MRDSSCALPGSFYSWHTGRRGRQGVYMIVVSKPPLVLEASIETIWLASKLMTSMRGFAYLRHNSLEGTKERKLANEKKVFWKISLSLSSEKVSLSPKVNSDKWTCNNSYSATLFPYAVNANIRQIHRCDWFCSISHRRLWRNSYEEREKRTPEYNLKSYSQKNRALS